MPFSLKIDTQHSLTPQFTQYLRNLSIKLTNLQQINKLNNYYRFYLPFEVRGVQYAGLVSRSVRSVLVGHDVRPREVGAGPHHRPQGAARHRSLRNHRGRNGQVRQFS